MNFNYFKRSIFINAKRKVVIFWVNQDIKNKLVASKSKFS